MKKTCQALLILICALCAVLLGGCQSGALPSFSLSAVSYDHAERYLMGGASLSAAVEKLQISWIDGRVQVERHSGDKITFSEEANRALDADTSLYYWLDGDTLHIQYCRSGLRNLANLEKELTLWLPEELTLRELEISTVSAPVLLTGIGSENLELKSVSGSICVADCGIAEEGAFSTTSGAIFASLPDPLRELQASTVSGTVELNVGAVETLQASSTSGALSLHLGGAPRELELETVSGDVALYLPEDAGFQLRFDTVSGDFSSTLACQAGEGRYLFGSGTGDFSVDTTSGDLTIRPRGAEED